MCPLSTLNTYHTLIARDQHYVLRNNNIPAPFTRTETYRRSYFPEAIRRWNQLTPNLKEAHTLEEFKQLLNTPSIPKQDILYYGDRWASIHHARIRIGCSKLNNHLCNNLHVIPSSLCDCGYEDETPIHFFFTCPLYNQQRAELHNSIIQLTTFSLHTLLYGDNNLTHNENKLLFDAVHKFIKDTNRFTDNWVMSSKLHLTNLESEDVFPQSFNQILCSLITPGQAWLWGWGFSSSLGLISIKKLHFNIATLHFCCWTGCTLPMVWICSVRSLYNCKIVG